MANLGSNISPTVEHVNSQAVSDRNVALWSLKLREVHKLSGSVCEEIREHTADMLTENRISLQTSTYSKLRELNLSADSLSAVSELLSQPSTYELSLRNLDMERHLNNYVEHNFGYVEPVEYLLQNLSAVDVSEDYLLYIPLLN